MARIFPGERQVKQPLGGRKGEAPRRHSRIYDAKARETSLGSAFLPEQERSQFSIVELVAFWCLAAVMPPISVGASGKKQLAHRSPLISATISAISRRRYHRATDFLKRAMIDLMDDRWQADNAHPAIWAPFVVVGEGAR